MKVASKMCLVTLTSELVHGVLVSGWQRETVADDHQTVALMNKSMTLHVQNTIWRFLRRPLQNNNLKCVQILTSLLPYIWLKYDAKQSSCQYSHASALQSAAEIKVTFAGGRTTQGSK